MDLMTINNEQKLTNLRDDIDNIISRVQHSNSKRDKMIIVSLLIRLRNDVVRKGLIFNTH